MRSRNPVYPLPQGSLSIYSNVTITTFPGASLISEWKFGWLNKQESFFFGATPTPNIPEVAKGRSIYPYGMKKDLGV